MKTGGIQLWPWWSCWWFARNSTVESWTWWPCWWWSWWWWWWSWWSWWWPWWWSWWWFARKGWKDGLGPTVKPPMSCSMHMWSPTNPYYYTLHKSLHAYCLLYSALQPSLLVYTNYSAILSKVQCNIFPCKFAAQCMYITHKCMIQLNSGNWWEVLACSIIECNWKQGWRDILAGSRKTIGFNQKWAQACGHFCNQCDNWTSNWALDIQEYMIWSTKYHKNIGRDINRKIGRPLASTRSGC